MNIKKINQLSKEIDEKSLIKSNSKSNLLWLYLSIFGNILAVCLEYLFLINLIKSFIPEFYGSKIILSLVLIILLSIFELIKRIYIRKVTIKFLKKKININFLPNLILTLIFVLGSVMMGINGAKNLTNKEADINIEANNISKVYEDSINIYYGEKLKDIDHQIKLKVEKLNEYESIDINQRNFSINNEIIKLDKQIKWLKEEFKNIENQKVIKINEYKLTIKNDASEKKEKNKAESLWFILIVGIIELFIAVGVVKNTFYDFIYYSESIISDNYKKLKIHLAILKIIFSNGNAKIGDNILSYQNILDKASIKNINVTKKHLALIMSTFGQLDILFPPSGKVKKINKSYDESKELIINYFSTDDDEDI